ncbi:hypothetical protein [Parapedobacter defluvii]|uniref:hypothetical protein n=1 Tax=Parapedobacter defluvii TaxID=2045106 RepID=UPI00333F8176
MTREQVLLFFCLSPAIFREFIGVYAASMWENHRCRTHTPCARHARWENKVRRKSGEEGSKHPALLLVQIE